MKTTLSTIQKYTYLFYYYCTLLSGVDSSVHLSQYATISASFAFAATTLGVCSFVANDPYITIVASLVAYG